MRCAMAIAVERPLPQVSAASALWFALTGEAALDIRARPLSFRWLGPQTALQLEACSLVLALILQGLVHRQGQQGADDAGEQVHGYRQQAEFGGQAQGYQGGEGGAE